LLVIRFQDLFDPLQVVIKFVHGIGLDGI